MWKSYLEGDWGAHQQQGLEGAADEGTALGGGIADQARHQGHEENWRPLLQQSVWELLDDRLPEEVSPLYQQETAQTSIIPFQQTCCRQKLWCFNMSVKSTGKYVNRGKAETWTLS